MKNRGPLHGSLRRICGLAAIASAVLAAGTLGFHWIEGQGLFDSFYMTLITLTTVGYEEIFELSDAGRYFNAILILVGFGTVFMILGIMVESILELDARHYFERKRTRKMIDRMSGHFIVCGLGRVGRGAIERLRQSGAEIVAIDSSTALEGWARENAVPLLTQDATLDVSLENAGARRANGLVAATSSDAVNVYITLSARVINPDLRIVARGSDEEASKKLIRAGANTVITPYRFSGYRIAQSLLRPRVSSFLDIASTLEGSELDLDIEEYHVTEQSPCSGKTIAGSGLTSAPDIILLALAKSDRPFQFNPPGGTLVEDGDVLIVMGHPTALDRMKQDLAA